MATYLLVHGAFQGGWVWQKVVSILQNQGHVVHAPTLSGCGYLFSDIRTEHDLKTFRVTLTSRISTTLSWSDTVIQV